jgi:antibiotic biosynthesis monooxygenase (ABM) superfamily enzyme
VKPVLHHSVQDAMLILISALLVGPHMELMELVLANLVLIIIVGIVIIYTQIVIPVTRIMD